MKDWYSKSVALAEHLASKSDNLTFRTFHASSLKCNSSATYE